MPADVLANAASAVACLVAISALYVALSQRKIASRALKLALAQEDRRAAALDLRIIDASSIRRPNGRWLLIDIVVTNPTDVDTTLVVARLRITYRLSSGGNSALIVDHAVEDATPVSTVQALELPERVQANGAARGLLVFFLPRGVLTSDAIDELQLTLSDARGAVASHDIWAPREVADGSE